MRSIRVTTRTKTQRSAGAKAAPVALSALFALFPFAGPLAGQQSAPDFDWSGTVAQGRTLEIHGVNGGVEASLSSDGRVHVHAERSARRSDPEGVRIEVVEHAGGVTICAVYPTPRQARQPNSCAPGGGSNSVNNNDVTVEFTVRVPAGVRFAGHTVNGAVAVEGLRSDVKVSTVNGGIDVSTTGLAEATTVNGDISARMGTAPTADLEFSTVNGHIELTLPAGLAADLDASTVNGSIDSDFDVTGRRASDRRSLRGTIGGGGADLELSTVNGEIRVREGR